MCVCSDPRKPLQNIYIFLIELKAAMKGQTVLTAGKSSMGELNGVTENSVNL